MPEKLLTPTQLFTLKTPEPANLNLCPPGIYKSDSLIKIENAPVDGGHGIIISTEHKINNVTTIISQLYFELSGSKIGEQKIYWRNCLGGIWGTWSSY
jgi:hypothetical protein